MKKNPSYVYEKFGIPWNFPSIFPWNSMEFHETEVDGIPFYSMEFREFTQFDGIRFRQGALMKVIYFAKFH
jgi:hypothetical protein